MSRTKGSTNRNFPPLTLKESLEVARAIQDRASGMQVTRLTLAGLLDRSPSSSVFRDLVASSRTYGLTGGGIQAEHLELTELGRNATSDSASARRDAERRAVLNIRPFQTFLAAFDGKRIPAPGPFREFLTKNAAIPANRAEECMTHILADAGAVGFLRKVKGGSDWVELNGQVLLAGENAAGEVDEVAEAPPDKATAAEVVTASAVATEEQSGQATSAVDPQRLTSNNRVFITHGRSREIAQQLRELLTFGGFEPVIAVDNETVAKPVPDKVMDDMRSCGAAIIHVKGEQLLLDREGNEHRIINSNVLIEIGAAMALYGRRFILLVERGVTLPSNLQGLYEARYDGDRLDYESTMKLLKAFNDFRN
jgi:predicted nucleotide-binding protein